MTLLDEIAAIIDRSDHVRDWPKDERDFYRDYGGGLWDSFTDRHEKLVQMRANKIIKLVQDADRAYLARRIEEEFVCCDAVEQGDPEHRHQICYWSGACRNLVLDPSPE